MDLKTKLENRIARLKREIASKESALKRAELDLENLAGTEARLKKQREVKLKKAGAPRKVEEVKSDLNEVVEEVAPAPAPAPEKEKSKLTFFS